MGEHEHESLGEEHPQSDRSQIVMLIILIAAWALDSFLFQRFTLKSVPMLVRLGVSVVTAGMGIYLVLQSHKLVIYADEPGLVDWGVYSVSRHPMYLGSILFELGLVFTTMSMLAFGIWLVTFLVYNRFAAYEENSLINVLGDDYRNYQQKVRRWGLF